MSSNDIDKIKHVEHAPWPKHLTDPHRSTAIPYQDRRTFSSPTTDCPLVGCHVHTKPERWHIPYCDLLCLCPGKHLPLSSPPLLLTDKQDFWNWRCFMILWPFQRSPFVYLLLILFRPLKVTETRRSRAIRGDATSRGQICLPRKDQKTRYGRYQGDNCL